MRNVQSEKHHKPLWVPKTWAKNDASTWKHVLLSNSLPLSNIQYTHEVRVLLSFSSFHSRRIPYQIQIGHDSQPKFYHFYNFRQSGSIFRRIKHHEAHICAPQYSPHLIGNISSATSTDNIKWQSKEAFPRISNKDKTLPVFANTKVTLLAWIV